MVDASALPSTSEELAATKSSPDQLVDCGDASGPDAGVPQSLTSNTSSAGAQAVAPDDPYAESVLQLMPDEGAQTATPTDLEATDTPVDAVETNNSSALDGEPSMSREQGHDQDPLTLPASGSADRGGTDFERAAMAYPPHPVFGPTPKVLPEPRGPAHIRGGRYVPDAEVDGAELLSPPFRATLRVASVRGASHRYANECRQDAFCVAPTSEAGGLIVAVADGVGSARFSHVGSYEAAQLATSRVPELLKNDEPAGRLTSWDLQEVADELASRAHQLGRSPGDLSTTLCLAAIPSAASEGDALELVLARIGDSSAYVVRGASDHGWEAVFSSPTDAESEFIDTKTAALPEQARADVRKVRVRAGDILILGTDGFLNPVIASERTRLALTRNWTRGHLPSLSEFLWTVDSRIKTYDDDRTAALIWFQGT